jgi:ABC-type uncharacterized transport system permease subunit
LFWYFYFSTKEVIRNMVVLILAAVSVFGPIALGVPMTMHSGNVAHGARLPAALVFSSVAVAVCSLAGFVVIGAFGQPLHESIIYWGFGAIFIAAGDLLCLLGCSEYGYRSSKQILTKGI